MNRFKEAPPVERYVSKILTTTSNGETSVNGQGQVLSYRHVRWMSGENIPDFHRRRREGELLPLTRFRQEEYSFSRSAFYNTKYIPNGNTDSIVGWEGPSYNSTCPFKPADLDNVRSYVQQYLPSNRPELVAASADKIYNDGLDLGTMLAESKSTCATIMSILKRIISVKSFPKVFLSGGSMADLWLEMRYGVRPILYDIQALNKLVNEGAKRRRWNESTGDSVTHSSVFTHYGSGNFKYEFSGTSTLEISQRGRVVADMLQKKVVVNPLQTAWELIPLSFVVDWLISVGSSIGAGSFLVSADRYFAAAGYKIELRVEGDYTFTPVPSFSCTGTHASLGLSYDLTYRDPTTISILPRFNVNLDLFKVADILALIRQRIT